MSGMRYAPAVPMPGRLVRTERLTLVPPGKENLPDLIRLKSDPRVFELMLHGVRSRGAHAGRARGRHRVLAGARLRHLVRLADRGRASSSASPG